MPVELLALLSTWLLGTTLAGTAAPPEIEHGAPGRYRLSITCTNWCGEATLYVEETVVDSQSGQIVARRRTHPREFEAVVGPDPPDLDSARVIVHGESREPGWRPRAPEALPAEEGPRARPWTGAPVRGEAGAYEVATLAAGQRNQILLIELILDTTTGEIVSRRWLLPRVYELVRDRSADSGIEASGSVQRAGATFGEGIRAQEFIAVLDTTSGNVVSRSRADTRSATRRDAVCLPGEQWIEDPERPGPYQLSITVRGPDDTRALAYETILDTREGRVVARRRVHQRAFEIRPAASLSSKN